MAKFIEVHNAKDKNHLVLVNVQHITEIRGNIIFLDDALPTANDYSLIYCMEDYFQIKEKINGNLAELKHGYWIKVGKTEGRSNILQCSVCGKVRRGIAKTPYCKDCGAKMDAERNTP